MKKLTYPLLCFPLPDGNLLGILVGAEVQAVEDSPRRLKATLSDHLDRDYKKNQTYLITEIEKPLLRILDISLRPAYRHEKSSYPLTSSVRVAMPMVYGETEPGTFLCHLPLLGRRFFCYDAKQIEVLARHFIINALDQESPEKVYRYSFFPEPTLELVTLKVDEKPAHLPGWRPKPKLEWLERLAELFPPSRSQRRHLSAFPDAAWEMDDCVTLVVSKLVGQRASLLVVGNPGVGKSAVLRQAFRKITTHAKKNRLEYSCWRLQAQRITSTAKYFGEWQETLEELMYELGSTNGILWVEDIAHLLQEGGTGAEDSVAAYMLPFIQNGELQIVGEATPQQLESMRRRLPGFVESLQLVEIPELPEQKLQLVFQKFSDYAHQHLKVNIAKSALELSIRLLKRFYPYESFPGKGIRFLSDLISENILPVDEAPNIGKVQNPPDVETHNRHPKSDIRNREVLQHFIRRTGLPEVFLRDDLALDQAALRSYFNQRIIGQQAAVAQLCDIVKVFKAGLNNPFKPITTLIFAGPTGVGKTASALALSQFFFGQGQRQLPLVRIDMSEFQHPAQIVRFLGAGGEPGKLVADVRERPFSVLLLDEAEKADPSVFDAFLTVLDEGMLTDAYGRITNFRNCIIILTSNLGATNRRSIGYGETQRQGADHYRSAIGKFFKPEFVNRIDNVVVFNSLSQEDVKHITVKELEEVKQREGFVKRGLEIHFSENVVNYLAGIGFHEKYGARPLQRALEDHVVKPLANWLLKNKAVENVKLEVDFVGKLMVQLV